MLSSAFTSRVLFLYHYCILKISACTTSSSVPNVANENPLGGEKCLEFIKKPIPNKSRGFYGAIAHFSATIRILSKHIPVIASQQNTKHRFHSTLWDWYIFNARKTHETIRDTEPRIPTTSSLKNETREGGCHIRNSHGWCFYLEKKEKKRKERTEAGLHSIVPSWPVKLLFLFFSLTSHEMMKNSTSC